MCSVVLGGACLGVRNLNRTGETLPPLQKFEQCFYLVAPRELVDDYLRKGVYILTPGWLLRWKEMLDQWGFDRDMAPQFFEESCTGLALVDTGVVSGSLERLKDFARFVKRPWERVTVGLDVLRLHMEKSLLHWKAETCREQRHLAERQSADYAMACELTARMAEIKGEKEAIDDILGLFRMLFAPEILNYTPIVEPVKAHEAAFSEDETDTRFRLENFYGDHMVLESGRGFLIKVSHREKTLGVVLVDGVAFPQYLSRYINLAMDVGKVCGLAIANARSYEIIKGTEKSLRHEIEERKKAEDARKRMEKEVLKLQKLEAASILAGGIAHDFNNLLGTIMGNINMAQLSIEPLEPVSHTLQEAYKGTLRAAELVKKFLVLSEAGMMSKLAADITTVLRNSVYSALDGFRVERRVSICENLWLVEMDPFQISQALCSVLENAGEAMPFGGAVDIKAENVEFSCKREMGRFSAMKPGKYVKISISDSGPGMESEHLDKIFDAYFSTKPRGAQKGMGMGLTLAYSIIKRHEGYLTVASRPGEGTTVEIHLPALDKAERAR